MPPPDPVSAQNVAPVLVVGRSGQLATDLAALKAGAPTVAWGRPDLDLRDDTSIARAIAQVRPCAVVNAAAYTAVDRAESEPEAAYALNRDAPAALARACRAAGLPLVHVSTDQVFDGTKTSGYVESDPPNPLCVYGASKLAGEEAVLAAHPDALVVRASWVFGPSGNNFVARVLEWARTRPVLQVVNDQSGRPTYSPGLGAALLELAAQMITRTGAERPSGLLHLAGADLMARDAQARAVMAASAARGGPTAAIEPVPTSVFPTPAIRPANADLDCSRAQRLYGVALGRFAPDLDATLDVILGRHHT